MKGVHNKIRCAIFTRATSISGASRAYGAATHKEIEMKRSVFVTAATAAIAAGAILAAQQQPGAKPTMGFFVTSTPIGDGANLGGLQGADAHCQKLAAASGQAGAGDRVWRAYLSTQGPNAVNARDRIGAGPWFNARGQQIAANAAELHGDTLEQARLGNRINKLTAVSEKGELVNGVGDKPNQHDILTGSQPDGRAFPAGKDKIGRASCRERVEIAVVAVAVE